MLTLTSFSLFHACSLWYWLLSRHYPPQLSPPHSRALLLPGGAPLLPGGARWMKTELLCLRLCKEPKGHCTLAAPLGLQASHPSTLFPNPRALWTDTSLLVNLQEHSNRVPGLGVTLFFTHLSSDGGAWWAAVHGVAKSQTWLSDFTFTFHFHALEKEMATHSSVLTWRIPGMGEPGGLPSLGSHRVRHDWSDLAAAVMLTPQNEAGEEIPSETHPPTLPAPSPLTYCDSQACLQPNITAVCELLPRASPNFILILSSTVFLFSHSCRLLLSFLSLDYNFRGASRGLSHLPHPPFISGNIESKFPTFHWGFSTTGHLQ